MSRRRITLYVVAGVLAYCAALAAMLPSAWIAHAVQRQSDGRLELREAGGTAWSGSGRLFARAPYGALIDLGAIRWNASAWSLPTLRIRASVTHGTATHPMLVELSPWGLGVQRLHIDLPGTAIAALAPALATLGPEGSIHVRSDSLRVERGSLLGLADVEWRGIRLSGAHGIRLGSHLARLRGGGERVDIDVTTLDGPLSVRAKGTWNLSAGLTLAGTAEPRTPDVVPFLRGFCAGYRDSVCEFSFAQGKAAPAPIGGTP